ncbi:MAG: histidine kinase [Acidimicrobiia bacterium]|nr:histidine kinase [Acidimicrobiia bacterium]
MIDFSEQLMNRLVTAISGLNWLFLVVGAAGTIVAFGQSQNSYAAIILAGGYVVALQMTPRRRLRQPFVRELAILLASIMASSATWLTGSLDSPFLLLTLTPIILAALLGGYRLGTATGLLGAGLLAVAELPSDNPDVAGLMSWLGLVVLAAITFGLARRLLLEAVERVDLLTRLSAETGARIEQLENANRLLTRLSALTDATDVTVEDIGASALQTIREAVPFTAASISIGSQAAGYEVAATGKVETDLALTEVPIMLGEEQVGRAAIYTPHDLSERQRRVIHELLQPAAIGFSNVELIERIAHTAIEQERLRVARELHDGIGPGLAALGLALDVEAMRGPESTRIQLAGLRDRVTDLVSGIRTTVADLRRGHVLTLIEAAEDAALQSKLELQHSVRQDGTLPPERVREITAIVVEAIRNAGQHSGASTVTVTGHLMPAEGHLMISDDGLGFEPDGVGTGRFGLIGMAERAERIGATLVVETAPGAGTTIVVSWPG